MPGLLLRAVAAAAEQPWAWCRKEDLLKWSRSWITRETLDDRILQALENPRLLFPGQELLSGSGFDVLPTAPAEPDEGAEVESDTDRADRQRQQAQEQEEAQAELDLLQEGTDEAETPHRP